MTQQTLETGRANTRRKSVLLVNSASRIGLEGFEQARTKLLADGVNLVGATSSSNLDSLLDHARSAIKERIPLLIVGGGDGTINAVAGLLANSRTAMAVLPLGTGNEFARDLQIPLTVEGACGIVSSGRTIHVDLGKVNDRFFVNILTAGLSTRIAEQLTNPMKKKFGRFAYAFAVFGGLRNLRPFHATLATENGTSEFECLQIVIGNGRLHAGPFPVLPDARLRAGKFSIYALKGNRTSELLKYALMLPGGHHANLAEIHTEHARKGSLVTDPRVKTTIDGEVSDRTPIQFESLPSALKVMVPANFDA
jgi:YegS/Rv2252/BmrU family lipid kinase